MGPPTDFPPEDFRMIFTNKKDQDGEILQEFKDFSDRVLQYWKESGIEYLYWKSKLRHQNDKLGYEATKFLEYFLNPNTDDGLRLDRLRLIFMTSRIRGRLREEYERDFVPKSRELLDNLEKDGTLPLSWLIEEWNQQSVGITRTTDSLTKALINKQYPARCIAWAQLSHARRMRLGVGQEHLQDRLKKNRNRHEITKISEVERLLFSAKSLLGVGEKVDDIFCFMPSENFEIYLEIQSMLTQSRRGDQSKVVGVAKGIISKLENLQKKGNKHPFEWQEHLLWYAHFALIRAASATNDSVMFKEATGNMRSLEEKIERQGYKDYFEHQQRGERLKLPKRPADSDILKWPDDAKLYHCLKKWAKFVNAKEDVTTVERLVLSNSAYLDESREKIMGMNNIDGSLNLGIFPLIHAIAGGRASRKQLDRRAYQKFVIGPRGSGEDRIKELMVEINLARFEVMTQPNHLSTAILEILSREVVYRMWFEVAKLAHQKRKRLKHEDTTVRAISLLEDIKDDIVSLRYNKSKEKEHVFIDHSILKLKECKGEQIAETRVSLRDIIDSSETTFTGESATLTGKKDDYQFYFLGMPLGIEGQDLSVVQHLFPPKLEGRFY